MRLGGFIHESSDLEASDLNTFIPEHGSGGLCTTDLPKLVKPGSEILTDQLSTHSRVRSRQHTGCAQDAMTTMAINLIQHPHYPRRVWRWRHCKQIVGGFTWLGQVWQDDLSFAVLEARPEYLIQRLEGGFFYSLHIIGGVGQIRHYTICIRCFLGIEHFRLVIYESNLLGKAFLCNGLSNTQTVTLFVS